MCRGLLKSSAACCESNTRLTLGASESAKMAATSYSNARLQPARSNSMVPASGSKAMPMRAHLQESATRRASQPFFEATAFGAAYSCSGPTVQRTN